ncbi:O-acyltransferase WSD-like [Chironomus tepperi]|uniref:O-acyltransferase WSD-like n=1 Tax=Chironomus tepperi TaxID=113505 RepID=UPI00391EF7F6
MEVKNPIIEKFELMKNYSNEFYGPLRTNDTKADNVVPLHLVSLVLMSIIIFTNFNFDKEKLKNRVLFVLKSPAIREHLYVITCFLVSMMFMPIVVLIVSAFKIYRAYVAKCIKNNKSFKGFLVGEDSFWVCEDDHAKSVINVLAFVNCGSDVSDKMHEKLLTSIRDRIHSKLMLPNTFPKMFYRKKRDESGYYYWTDENYLTINDYVRFMNNSQDMFMTDDDFKDQMSSICNQSLPANHSALWECLISRQAIQYDDGIKYPVIFRVHHSVGDGVALLRLFLEALADKEDVNIEGNPVLMQTDNSFSMKFMRFLSNVVTIIKTPSVLCTQMQKQIDINRIHPSKLSGNKKINWIYESNNNNNDEDSTPLLTVVKLLKRKFPGSRFSNILLAALSKSLKDYFMFKKMDVPKDMTVVIPARICHESPTLKLQNKFSVALQTIPIDMNRTTERVERVRRNSQVVISSPDYQINYFLLSVVAGLFPDWILKNIINSKHATMAVSNLPGPNFSLKINGFAFESVGFFIPNVGQTACGITILSYNNKLHFGAIADENSVGSVKDLGMILNGMVNELHGMAENLM